MPAQMMTAKHSERKKEATNLVFIVILLDLIPL